MDTMEKEDRRFLWVLLVGALTLALSLISIWMSDIPTNRMLVCVLWLTLVVFVIIAGVLIWSYKAVDAAADMGKC